MKSKTEILLIVLVIVLSAIAYLAVREIRSDGAACMVNPFQYGIKEVNEKYGVDSKVTLTFNNQRFKTQIITENGTYPIN